MLANNKTDCGVDCEHIFLSWSSPFFSLFAVQLPFQADISLWRSGVIASTALPSWQIRRKGNWLPSGRCKCPRSAHGIFIKPRSYPFWERPRPGGRFSVASWCCEVFSLLLKCIEQLEYQWKEFGAMANHSLFVFACFLGLVALSGIVNFYKIWIV